MAIRVTCPGCGAVCAVPDTLDGKNVRCQRCRQVFVAASARRGEESFEGPSDLAPVPAKAFSADVANRGGCRPLLIIVASLVVVAGMSAVCILAAGLVVWHRWSRDVPAAVADAAQRPGGAPAGWENNDKAPPELKPLEQRPAVELKLPPAPPAPVGGLKPAPLKADRDELALPASIADACIGGGGRYFILHLPQHRRLAIFDVNVAKVVKYLALADDNVKFAAGMDKLFVISADKGVIQRFNLATFEKEVTARLPLQGTVLAIATGSAASGPLLVHYARGDGQGAPVTFLDPVSFNELNFDKPGGVLGNSVFHYRASPDGTVFGSWVTVHSQSMGSIVLAGKTAKLYGGEMAGSVVPGTDNTLVTAGGLYTPECKLIGGDKDGPRYHLRVPSQGGRFYITCPGGGGAQFNTGELDTGKPVRIYLMGDARPIATLKDAELPASNEAWTGSDFTQDKRVLFVPDGKLIAIIPRSNDRLVLHRFDIDEAMDKAGIHYLFVVSRPPSTAYRGTRLAYTPQVKSKKGKVKLKLEAGPQGMGLTAEGKLTWDVPRDFAEAEVDVILTVSDASGQEVFHTFKLAVRDRADAGPQ
jgi:hypothetical protein